MPVEGDLVVIHLKIDRRKAGGGVWPVFAIVDRVQWIKTRDKKALNTKLGSCVRSFAFPFVFNHCFGHLLLPR